MLKQGAAGRGRSHALAAAHQERSAERLLHVADAGGGGGKGEMRDRWAPPVMLPASATSRNRPRSVRSNRIQGNPSLKWAAG